MKFKDKDGNVFDNIIQAMMRICELGRPCMACALARHNNGTNFSCKAFCITYPVAAAHLMGYEVLEDGEDINAPDEKEETMEKTKPLSEWTLGEVKEYCEGRSCKGCEFYAGEGGESRCRLLLNPPVNWDLTQKPRFTDSELEQLRAFAVLFGAEARVRRTYNGEHIVVSLAEDAVQAHGSLLPSLKPGEEVLVKDYLGGE